jgi:multiple sugar transport system permease protein
MTTTLTEPGTKVPGTRKRRLRGHPVALMLPALVLTAILLAVPIIATIVRVISDGGAGLGQLFAMPNFGQVMLNTVGWTIGAVIGAMLIGYVGAIVLQSKSLRLVGLWRSLIMIPWIIPGVVGATIWRWSLSTDYGLINRYLLDLGLISKPVNWLSDPGVVLWAVVVIQIWVTAPFVVLMVSAALAAIPEERHEAARLDGASAPKLLWYIVLPSIRTTTAIALLTLTIWALNSFTIIYVTTSGGPAGASTILPILLYQAFQNGNESLIAAVALLQLVIGGVLAVFFARTQKTDIEDQS